ncbi:MAG: pyridoxamine 5'-phosphate oxidase family protein [Actinomycetota bacterium]
MGKVIEALDDRLIEWIGRQHVFFVASAPTEGGHVNVSPKGHDTLRVLSPTLVAYLDLTGSGAETIAHTRENGRTTIMLCAFEGPPQILRLFGTGTAHPIGTSRFAELAPRFPDLPGARAVIEVELERIQTSCGYSIPFMAYQDERPTLRQWAERKGDDGLRSYWAEKNTTSIDGLPALDS